MIQSILVPLDGSPYSEAALELGIRWAQRTRATLVGLGIVDEPTICKPEATGIGGSAFKVRRDERRLDEARARVASFLERFTRRCADASVTCRSVEHVGLPSERILFEAEDHDLTLLGQRTYFHFETQQEADETLTAVLQASRRPVVAVPQKLPASRSAVVAYDGSPPAVRALEAFQKARLEEWHTVRVLSVADDLAEATRHAEEAARFLRFYTLPAEARPLPASRDPVELLLEQVRDLHAGMLVMGAFGQAKLVTWWTGSTTQTVLKEERDLLIFFHH
jgi:nucleotide-binding universal stress UspA family protein